MTAPVPTTTKSRGGAGGATARPQPTRPWLAWLGVAAVGFTALVGGNALGLRDTFFEPATNDPVRPVSGRVAGAPSTAEPTALRSYPWWQEVQTFQGTGTMTLPPLMTADGARWRVTASCRSARIVVRSTSQDRPVLDAPCAPEVTGFARPARSIDLDITTQGPWKLTVAQQIDTPLVEPPLAQMTAAGSRAVATGTFSGVDERGIGTVTVYEQADGRYSLRLEDFYVSPNADLQLRLSALETPRNTEDYLRADSEIAATLDVTAGSLNYTLPLGGDPTRYRSLVVWYSPTSSIYAAATLRPVP